MGRYLTLGEVGVHSALANKCVAALLEGRHVPSIQGYSNVTSEVTLESFLAAKRTARQARPFHATGMSLQSLSVEQCAGRLSET